ncbi:glycosyltransferase family protein [Azospirillum sp. sgz301742]
MQSSIERDLLNPQVRRNVVDNVRELDGGELTFEVLIVASVCAVMDRRFADADAFFELTCALAHTTARPGPEHAQLLMCCLNAIKVTLYGGDAVSARQCSKILKLLELVDPEHSGAHAGALPGRLPAIGRPHVFPYAERPLSGVEADILIRKHFYGPGSRLHDIGWRTATGLERSGWKTRQIDLRHDLGFNPDAVDAFTARRAGARRRFAFVDLPVFFGPNEIPAAVAFLQRLRPHYDAIVCMIFDAWTPGLDVQLRECLPHLDLIWAVHPYASAFSNPAIAAKATFIPVMTGIDPEMATPAPAEGAEGDHRLSFAGSIEAFNVHRMYWYLLSRQYPEFLHFSVSDSRDDGLSVEASQALYLDRLRRTKHCLNLSRRATGYRALTGRAFEVPAMNRLLVQEYCEDVRYYFRPGEHFVEFETIDELLASADDIRSRPEHFRRMAGDAHRFFRERYADDAVTRHLSHLLG